MKKSIVCLIGFFITVSIANAQVSFNGYEHLFTEPLHYNVYSANELIVADGKLTEGAWKAVPWSADFTDIEGSRKPAPAYRTRFKMLWDSSRLYIAAELEDPAIWATLTRHDAVVFYDNDFEVFIDPDGDTHDYFEIEVNALKTVFDLFLSKPYRNEGSALISWNTEDLRVGVDVDGTMNKVTNKDKKWTVEMAIPFRSISVGDMERVPTDKTIWRINFSRVEWDVDIVNGLYKKRTDSVTGRGLPEHNWVWSPQGVVNMHYPERWGYIQFLNSKPVGNPVDLQLPESEHLKKLLWLIYYKQKSYLAENGRYAGTLDSLVFPVNTFQYNSRTYNADVEATATLFEATLEDKATNEKWKINQDGKVKRIDK